MKPLVDSAFAALVANSMRPEDSDNYPALLPGGFHPVDLADLFEITVSAFEMSTTRRQIMAGVEALAKAILENGVACEMWVDGSFLTEKINPNDADILILIPAKALESCTKEQYDFFEQLADAHHQVKSELLCDCYVLAEDNNNSEFEFRKAYWMRQFGFDRADDIKGLPVITFSF